MLIYVEIREVAQNRERMRFLREVRESRERERERYSSVNNL